MSFPLKLLRFQGTVSQKTSKHMRVSQIVINFRLFHQAICKFLFDLSDRCHSVTFLFVQVQATHPYAGEDVDELTFESGEVISVLSFPSPEDQVK